MTTSTGDNQNRAKPHPHAWIAVAVLEALLLEGAVVLGVVRPWGEASVLPALLLTLVFLFYLPLLVTRSEKWEELWLVRQLRRWADDGHGEASGFGND